jgi:hypothetical protein
MADSTTRCLSQKVALGNNSAFLAMVILTTCLSCSARRTEPVSEHESQCSGDYSRCLASCGSVPTGSCNHRCYQAHKSCVDSE